MRTGNAYGNKGRHMRINTDGHSHAHGQGQRHGMGMAVGGMGMDAGTDAGVWRL